MLKMSKKSLKWAFQAMKGQFSIGSEGVIPTTKYVFKNMCIYKQTVLTFLNRVVA